MNSPGRIPSFVGTRPATALVWALLLAGTGMAHAETRFSDSVVINTTIDEDLYAAAGEVRIEGAVAGAAVIGAGSAAITGDVEGDVLLAGGRVVLAGGVGDDLRVAGGSIQLTGFVTDQAAIAGGSVIIEPGSAIGGRTWIAAGEVEVAGQIGDDLRVAAGTAVISGRIAGDVEVAAQEIRVESGAMIGGDLVWRGKEPPIIAEDAEILGTVREAGGAGEPPPVSGEPPAGEASARFLAGWGTGIALVLAALMLLWAAPQLVARAAATFGAAPGGTLLLGAGALVLTPIAAFVLFATLLGWLLGLVVMAGYVFALLLSGLVGLLIMARLLGNRFGSAVAPDLAATGRLRSLLSLALVVTAFVLLQRIPGLGWLAGLLLVLAGLGAITALVTGRAPGASGGGSTLAGTVMPRG